MSQFWNLIEQSIHMPYYQLYEENCFSLPYEWIIHFETSIQVAYAKIYKYTPCDWRMYN